MVRTFSSGGDNITHLKSFNCSHKRRASIIWHMPVEFLDKDQRHSRTEHCILGYTWSFCTHWWRAWAWHPWGPLQWLWSELTEPGDCCVLANSSTALWPSPGAWRVILWHSRAQNSTSDLLGSLHKIAVTLKKPTLQSDITLLRLSPVGSVPVMF